MKLYTIDTGYFKLDGGAMFGVVPKVLWSRTNPADENNFYFWKNGPAVYILETRPDLFTPRPTPQNPDRTPQPKDCCNFCYK